MCHPRSDFASAASDAVGSAITAAARSMRRGLTRPGGSGGVQMSSLRGARLAGTVLKRGDDSRCRRRPRWSASRKRGVGIGNSSARDVVDGLDSVIDPAGLSKGADHSGWRHGDEQDVAAVGDRRSAWRWTWRQREGRIEKARLRSCAAAGTIGLVRGKYHRPVTGTSSSSSTNTAPNCSSGRRRRAVVRRFVGGRRPARRSAARDSRLDRRSTPAQKNRAGRR